MEGWTVINPGDNPYGGPKWPTIVIVVVFAALVAKSLGFW